VFQAINFFEYSLNILSLVLNKYMRVCLIIDNMEKIAAFFVLGLLLLAPVSVAAGASQPSCDGGTCKNLKITKLTINPSGKTVPMKIGFMGVISGPVKRVQYQVINSKTGKVATYCNSYCAKCKKGKCNCGCTLKEPGTFDVKMTAYGPDNCCVTLIKKAAIVAKESAEPVEPKELTPSFKSTISGKKVTFKDTSSGIKPTKWTWNFGDGSKSTSQNPSHTYKKAGTYKVCLTVCSSKADDCKSICNKVVVK
jgi:hypothetical protein